MVVVALRLALKPLVVCVPVRVVVKCEPRSMGNVGAASSVSRVRHTELPDAIVARNELLSQRFYRNQKIAENGQVAVPDGTISGRSQKRVLFFNVKGSKGHEFTNAVDVCY